MPRRAAKRDPSEKRMLSWRENEEVVQTAIAISEKEDSNKQVTFSSLFRNGIALHDLQGQVKSHLKAQRLKEVEGLEKSRDEIQRREAKSRRTMLTLYEPTDREVMEYIITATREKMNGKVSRDEPTAEEEEQETFARFPENVPVKFGMPPVDAGTAVAKIGARLIGEGGADSVSARLRGVLRNGDAWAVTLSHDALQQFVRVPSSEMADDEESYISIRGEFDFTILFSDGRIAVTKSRRDGRTGEYSVPETIHEFLGVRRPKAFVIEWLDGAVRIGPRGITYYRLPRPVDTEIEMTQFVVEYEGYVAVYKQGGKSMQMFQA